MDDLDIDFEHESEVFLTPPGSSDEWGDEFHLPQYDSNAEFEKVQF